MSLVSKNRPLLIGRMRSAGCIGPPIAGDGNVCFRLDGGIANVSNGPAGAGVAVSVISAEGALLRCAVLSRQEGRGQRGIV